MAMREKSLSMKTLVSMIQGLEGKTTTIEFRDEDQVEGKIENVDGYMNIEMKDVTYVAASGVKRKFSKYLCQGKFVRYIIIPEQVNPIETIKERLEVLSRIKPGRGRGRGGRGGRGRGGRGGPRRSGGGGGGSYGTPRPSYSSHGGYSSGGYISSGSYGSSMPYGYR